MRITAEIAVMLFSGIYNLGDRIWHTILTIEGA